MRHEDIYDRKEESCDSGSNDNRLYCSNFRFCCCFVFLEFGFLGPLLYEFRAGSVSRLELFPADTHNHLIFLL